MTAASQTSVLIVGGGPVGLTLSALLSGYGVEHLLVEAHPGTSRHPKARGVSARSMEILRRLGVEAAVRAAGLPADQVCFFRGRDLVDPDFVRTGVGQGAGKSPRQGAGDGTGEEPGDEPGEEPGEEHTPSPGIICSQDALEPVLLRHAEAAAGPRTRIRFGTRLAGFTEDGEGVLADLEDAATGARSSVRARWLVGCDGAASTVRAGAGIAMDGPTGLGRYLSVRFEAPLGPVVADRASASYFLTVPGRGGFMAVDNDRHWIYQYPLAADTPGHGRLADLIRTAAGVPGLDVTVRDTMTWRMDAQLAAAYRRSRVLLAGDAAHVVPPTGGHGMNTGIGDADNLAWKLAAVTAGHAGEALLDTYEAERRPIARQVIDISTDNARNRAGYRLDDELLLTAAYASAAVLHTPGTTPEPTRLTPDGYRPDPRPGRRLPHLRLAGTTSTLDLVGPGFTLLTPTGGRARPLPRTGFPLTHRELAPALWARLSAGATALLVRPDGHIAWRGTDPSAGLPDVLRLVLRPA